MPTNHTVCRSQLLSIAQAELGVSENPPGSNTGSRVTIYQSSCSLSQSLPTGWPWCAAFVCWTIQQWLNLHETQKILSLANPEDWRPKTASAFGFLPWARAQNLQILSDAPFNQPYTNPGDLVIFDCSHIGFLISDDSSTVTTIDGNTSGTSPRDGGMVAIMTRPRSTVRNFICLI